MANSRACDSCGAALTEANPLVAKLFLAPIQEGKTRQTHGSYTGHGDIGKCCAQKAMKMIKWQKRKRYGSRSNGRTGHPVGTRKRTTTSRS